MVEGIVDVVNIIPRSLSGETSQDSEPNLAVNPENPKQMVATAFTPPPMGGANAPIFVSTDGGSTWSLRNVVPGNSAGGFPTLDISVSFGTSGGTLYAAILRGDDPARRMQILRSSAFSGTATMAVLSDRTGPDQPWVVSQSRGNADRLWVGNNSLGSDHSATVDHTADARAATPTFDQTVLEVRDTSGQDGPPVRLAAHRDGTVYAAFVRWSRAVGANKSFDIVVTRDDHWGTGTNAFADLVDGADHVVGARVAQDLYAYFGDVMGQERLGADIAIAVDPTDSSTVWLAWGYKYGGVSSSIPWAVDIAHSTDGGLHWAPLIKTVLRAKNPAFAINSRGVVAFLYQLLTDDTDEWVTQLEITDDAFASDPETHVLHRAPSSTPSSAFLPYLGDYVRMVSVGRNFYGIFSGSNVPDMSHFPSGITYQRNADFPTNTLHGVDGVKFVPPSIDPFFFSWKPGSLEPRGIHPIRGITAPQAPKVAPGPPSTIIPRISRLPIELPEPPTDFEL